ncbi:MAG: methyltransferase domain-containing protein [Halobacteriaceae archaeon]
MYFLEFAGDDDPFARAEAKSILGEVESIASGIALAPSIDGVGRLAFTRRASELLVQGSGGESTAAHELDKVDPEREGTIAVRARNVRNSSDVNTLEVERELGTILVNKGFRVDLDDPDHVLRAVFADKSFAVGWLALEPQRAYHLRRPTSRPFFQPGSMDPKLARAIVNLSGINKGSIAFDPMCGTGGLLIEAGLVGAEVVGMDAQQKMVRGARRNLRDLDLRGNLMVADAARVPIINGGVDVVLLDAPYGRQSAIKQHELHDLLREALIEANRIASRAVVVSDQSLLDIVERSDWNIQDVFERQVHGSLSRYIHVLDSSQP